MILALLVGMYWQGRLEKGVLWFPQTEQQLVGCGMALFCIISHLLCLVGQEPEISLALLNPIVYLTAFFTRFTLILLFLAICLFLGFA